MKRTGPFVIPLLFSLFILAGCISPEEREANAARRAGDWHGAAQWMRRLARRLPDDSDVEKKWRSTADKAAGISFREIDRQLGRGDLTEAERSAETAIYHAPENRTHLQRLTDLYSLRREKKDDVRRAREAMERGDWVGALAQLESLQAFTPTFPEIGPMSAETVRENYKIAMREGERFLKITDYERSIHYFDKALTLVARDEKALERKATAVDRQAARMKAHEAEALFKEKHYRAALDRAKAAVRLHPESTFLQAVLLEAYRLSAEDCIGRCKSALKENRRHEALSAIEEAVGLKVPQRRLSEEAALLHERITKELAGGYMARGIRMKQKGYYGAAWIHFKLAGHIRPGFSGLKALLMQTETLLNLRKEYRMLVIDPRDGGHTAPGSSRLLGAFIRKTLDKERRVAIRTCTAGEMDGASIGAIGLPPDGILKGTTERLWIETGKPVIEKARATYIAGKVPELNPQVEFAKQMWENSKRAVPGTEQALQQARDNFNKRKAKIQNLQNQYNQVQAQPYNFRDMRAVQARNSRLSWLQNQLNMERSFLIIESTTMIAAQASLQQAHQNVQNKLNSYLSQPPYIFVPKQKTYVYDKTRVDVKVTGAATFRLKDCASGQTSPPLPVTTGFMLRDTIVAAFSRAGIKEDPYEVPEDGKLLEKAAADLARKLADKVFKQVLDNNFRLLVRAGKERKQNNTPGELHYLVIAWQRRATLSPQVRKLVRERVKELTGFDLEEGGRKMKSGKKL